MIEIKNLSKIYKGEFLYKDFGIAFEKEKVTVITGPSGGGKTTLLRLMIGAEKCEKGQVLGFERENVAFVFQEDRLLEWLSIYENIAYVLKSYMEYDEMGIVIKQVLEIVELWAYKDYKIKDLSGGMQRRVAVARALAYKSTVLLMDEPFKGLDDDLKYRIINRLKKLWKEEGKTVIIITHSQTEASILGDYTYKLQEKPVRIYKI